MPRIEWTATGHESIYTIASFIARESQNLDVAFSMVDRVEEKCRQLAAFPHSGLRRPDLANDLRSAVVASWVVVYRPLKDGVRILLVVEASRDLPTAFSRLHWGT